MSLPCWLDMDSLFKSDLYHISYLDRGPQLAWTLENIENIDRVQCALEI